MTHRHIAGVVEDEDLDRHLVVHEGLQFLHVHLDAAVARQADHAPIRLLAGIARARCADRGRQVIPHPGRPGIHDHLLTALEPQRLQGRHTGRAVGKDEQIIVFEVVRQLIDEDVRVDRCVSESILREDHGVLRAAFGTPRQPCRPGGRHGLAARKVA